MITSTIAIKPGTDVSNLTAAIWFAVAAAARVSHQHIVTVTCGRDGQHMAASLHYSGNAVDLRIAGFPGNPSQWRDDIAFAIGKDYDVILEKDHIHIEYQPKK